MLGLVDDDRAGLSQRDMEPCLVIVYSYPTSRVYTRNRQSHQHTHDTELVGSTKKPSPGFPNISSEK